MNFVGHIHCLIKSLLLRSLVHFAKLRLHKHFGSHSHGSFTIKRHGNWILTFFLGVPHYSWVDRRNLSGLSWQDRYDLFSSWCRENSLWRKRKSNALMQTWFKLQLITHFSNENWPIGDLGWSHIRCKSRHVESLGHLWHPGGTHDRIFDFLTHPKRW